MTSPFDVLVGDSIYASDFDPLAALTGPWSSYTPTWTGSSSNPAIGNGAIDANYVRAGDLLLYKGVISAGSTTTFGTGYWIITIPVAITLGLKNVGVCALHDASTPTNDRPGAIEVLSSTTFRVVANGQVSGTVPFTWASSDVLQWMLIAEVA